MRLSQILKGMNLKTECEIYGEQEFERLALVDHVSDKKTCVFLADIKYLSHIKENVSMIICDSKMDIKELVSESRGVCVVQKPRVTFFKIHNYLMAIKGYPREKHVTSIAKTAIIADTAVISKDNVIIGENVIIEDLVVIKENTIIGDDSIIRSGSVIGNSGYEFKRDKNQIMPVVHGGGVIIGRNVIIGANVVVDRAVYPWDNTIVGNETKVDSLVSIAHGAKIGEAVMLVSQSFVAGRVVIDACAKVGPGSVIRNAMHIGTGANISMGSVVTQDVADGGCVTGNFAINHEKFINYMKEISQ